MNRLELTAAILRVLAGLFFAWLALSGAWVFGQGLAMRQLSPALQGVILLIGTGFLALGCLRGFPWERRLPAWRRPQPNER